MEYPKELHNKHNELPFLPEKMNLTSCIEKLTCNLYDKEKYVVHIILLQQALKHGLILKKVHRVIEYKQSAWLKLYIDMNTDLRKKAKNDFEKNFFKLMNNSVFGKTMENSRNHRNIQLVTSERQRKWYTSKPNYQSTNRFSDKLIAVELRKGTDNDEQTRYIWFENWKLLHTCCQSMTRFSLLPSILLGH